jgi:hypothetical protein
MGRSRHRGCVAGRGTPILLAPGSPAPFPPVSAIDDAELGRDPFYSALLSVMNSSFGVPL